ncbi:MAG: hypothetical protein DWQ04_30810 [Chloroflexi bacterium]|nr:MAG: hypothetical protein DWQ04_30810 [Chloroflexota bacterium]
MKTESLKANWTIFILLSLALLLTVLIGCGPDAAPEEDEQEASAALGVEVAMAEEIVEETAVPTSTPAVITETVAVDYCLDCHVNKEMLIDTADPEEEVISENEGAG